MRCWGPVSAVVLLAIAAGGCKREQRGFHTPTPAAIPAQAERANVSLHPGTAEPTTVPAARAAEANVAANRVYRTDYEQNAPAMAEGQRLYKWMNCVGCHAHGGGGMGPPLLDNKWLYGSEPNQVYQSIVEGRPNGMPSYRDRLTQQQVWQLVAYVRSLSGQARVDAAPGRGEEIQAQPAPSAKTAETPAPQSQPASVPVTPKGGTP